MSILNLGCGGKSSPDPAVINIDWSVALRLRRSFFGSGIAPLFLSGERLREFASLGENILVHDLSKGIPFPDGSVDAVYHCHLLEHLDREHVAPFMADVRRVLKAGGVHRIVVPDFHALVMQYVEHCSLCLVDTSLCATHDQYIGRIIEQCVRKESYGTSRQKPLRRWLENKIFGDARHRGETHQWMYDEINLAEILLKSGFRKVESMDYRHSHIVGWSALGLDLGEDGGAYKPQSIYIEAIK